MKCTYKSRLHILIIIEYCDMSRCFPFPPPGYEKTLRLEERFVLKEEKKEKKHKKEKKEKKDREKREGKEKKEKRDKKEKHKKEKHRDTNTKEKEKEKGILGIKIDDKLDSSTKEEGKNLTFGSNAKNGSSAVYLHTNGEQNNPIPIPIPIPSSNNNNNNLVSRGTRDSNVVVELAKRVNDEEKVIHGHDRLDKNGDSRFVEELARRFKDEEKVTTNQLYEGNFVVDKKGKEKDKMINDKSREKSTVQIVAGIGKSSIGEKLLHITEEYNVMKNTQEKDKPKESSDKSRKKHKSKDGEKKSHKKDKDTEKEKKKKKKKDKKNNTEPVTRCDEIKPNGPVNSSNELMGIVEATEKRRKEMETNEPVNSSNGCKVMGSVPLSDPRSNEKRRKDSDTNGGPIHSINASSSTTYPANATHLSSVPFSVQKNHAIAVRNEKKLKKIDMNEPDNVSNTTTKNYTVGVTQVMGPIPLSDHRNNAHVEGIAKKRKDIDVNGLIYDNEAKLNKVPRLSSDSSLENGRKPEAHRSVKMATSEKHGSFAAKSLEVDNNNEQQKNGVMDVKSVQILGPNHPSVLNDHHQIIEKSRKHKPPHPDTEFLSQILTVPKMDEWSGFDDQEWLFRGQDPRKPEVGGGSASEELQVWSEALNIDSMDIVALPYVLPY